MQDDDDVDHVEEFIKSLPDGVQETVRALDTLDEDVCKLEAEFRKELRALERKYEVLEKPLFEKRSALVSGAEKPADAKAADGGGVPDFWLGAMKNCMVIAANITEKDEVILKSLTNITTETLPEEVGVGFELTFHFKENEFFTNKVLTKTYHMAGARPLSTP